MCLECTNGLIKHSSSRFAGEIILSCPLCREVFHSSEINYVKLGVEGRDSKEETSLVSYDHASKIIAVTQTLLSIRRTEPTAKALVFSSVRETIH